jgi:hypothetical protein
MNIKPRTPQSMAPARLRHLLVLVSALGVVAAAWAQARRVESSAPARIPAAEFARIVQDSSENEGFFQSDVFVSNESTYLAVVDKLRELGASGGAYIGVGPEQNFTYIAKIRPRIAFVVDIRRQAVIQHLIYKAIFQVADDRRQFLSRLLSRPLGGEGAPAGDAPVEKLMEYFGRAPSSAEMYAANLERIAKIIREDFQIPLSGSDLSSLEYVFGTFRAGGLAVSSNFAAGRSRYPSLRDIIEQPGPNGRPGNFLASDEDYGYVRDLHRRNRIIPLVGDFAGPKALRAVGEYLRRNSYTVTAFYTSNVEQYLFRNSMFGTFAANVKALPITSDSLFIRAVMQRPPVVQIPGARSATLLQRIAVFQKAYDEGLYTSYAVLARLNYILDR